MKRSNSPWAITLCTIREIPVRIHASFFLLLIWVAYGEAGRGGAPLTEVLFILILFGCVMLHELGHALVARHYKIKTRDIVLYPFGGIATLLNDAPPKAELFIAVAGPLVNVVIALLLLPFAWSQEFGALFEDPSLLTRVFVANIVLVIFNLIPALPMDGGRILRASLALGGFRRATVIASRVSQVLSVGIGILGLISGNPFLIVIGVLVFSGAMQEIVRTRTNHAISGRTVKELMIERSRLECFPHGMTLVRALDLAITSLQGWFPVVYNDELLGIIHKEDLIRAAALRDEEHYVSEYMNRDFVSVTPDEHLGRALELARMTGEEPLVVKDNGVFLGLLFGESILEFMLVDNLRDSVTPTGREEDALE